MIWRWQRTTWTSNSIFWNMVNDCLNPVTDLEIWAPLVTNYPLPAMKVDLAHIWQKVGLGSTNLQICWHLISFATVVCPLGILALSERRRLHTDAKKCINTGVIAVSMCVTFQKSVRDVSAYACWGTSQVWDVPQHSCLLLMWRAYYQNSEA